MEGRSGDPTPGGVQEAQASLGSVIAQPCQYLERIPGDARLGRPQPILVLGLLLGAL